MNGKQRSWWLLVLHVFFACVGWFCCYRLIINSATAGISRLFTTLAIIQPGIDAADSAVRFSPTDPEAHYTRGLTLVNLGRLPDAVVELRNAIGLRPHHYYQWLDLGVTLDRVGDQAGAIAALNESVKLAPAFAQPRWQLGNLLFRQGQYDEAFNHLRLAVRSNPSLSEGMLQLSWVAAEGDPGRFEALVQPQASRKRFELAAFLARQGSDDEAVNQIRRAGQPQDEAAALFLRHTITQLLAAQNFQAAYAVWVTTHSASVAAAKDSQILNGDFVSSISQNDPGFGWQLAVVPNIAMSIDTSGPQAETRSILLEYQGESPTGSQPLQQLVLIEKSGKYSLIFSARADRLVTGGPPIIVVLDGSKAKTLGQSEAIKVGSTGWNAYSVDFEVDEGVQAIAVAVQRLACSQSPCPVFGRLWLSGFRMSRK